MAITVECKCGDQYNLKDEFAGRLVQCPRCGQSLRVPLPPPREIQPQADPLFDRDTFLLRQKYLAISEKYYIWDEQGRPILFVERPAHLARNLFALFGGLVAAILTLAILGVLAALLPEGPWQAAGFFLAVALAAVDFLAVFFLLSVKRHVSFYRDDSKEEPLLHILQDCKFQPIVATYTVIDNDGNVLARLRKNYLYNFIRRRWHCHDPNGKLLCRALEDSLVLSLLRRLIGPLFGVLRTNFVITAGESDLVIGAFNRKFTILDRYVLDLRDDPARCLDRRVALALGVMLDTGEKR
jgi:uncharacterized protein YxjI